LQKTSCAGGRLFLRRFGAGEVTLNYCLFWAHVDGSRNFRVVANTDRHLRSPPLYSFLDRLRHAGPNGGFQLKDVRLALRPDVCATILPHCDATPEEIRIFLLAGRGIEVSMGCLWNTLRQLELPFSAFLDSPVRRILFSDRMAAQ
jgi:hypothetical protein